MKQTETLVWVLYDIQKDKARTKVAKTCKEAGLYRAPKVGICGHYPAQSAGRASDANGRPNRSRRGSGVHFSHV